MKSNAPASGSGYGRMVRWVNDGRSVRRYTFNIPSLRFSISPVSQAILLQKWRECWRGVGLGSGSESIGELRMGGDVVQFTG